MKVILFVVDPFACVVYLAKSCSQFATKLAGLPTKYTSSLLVAEMRSYILSEELGIVVPTQNGILWCMEVAEQWVLKDKAFLPFLPHL